MASVKWSGFTEWARTRAQERANHALAIVRSFETNVFERLEDVIDSVPCQSACSGPVDQPSAQTDKVRGKKNPKKPWPIRHEEFIVKKKLSSAELEGRDSFRIPMLSSKRQSDAMFLKFAAAAHDWGWDWRKDTLVATPGQSVDFCNLARDVFPCVTPHGPFLVLRAGKATCASGLHAMALQGVQEAEIRFFNLHNLPSAILHDLAGNAFTANICVACLLAGFVLIRCPS